MDISIFLSLSNNSGNISKNLNKFLIIAFDLFESNGNISSINIYYHDDFSNNHSLVYIRKDLLNKFLSEKKLRFVWAIWGEREVTFKTNERRHDFFTAHPFKEHQVFQKIIEYVE